MQRCAEDKECGVGSLLEHTVVLQALLSCDSLKVFCKHRKYRLFARKRHAVNVEDEKKSVSLLFVPASSRRVFEKGRRAQHAAEGESSLQKK